MELNDTFEPIRASLLQQSPLPTLNQAISELLSKETHLSSPQTISRHRLCIPSSQLASSGFSRGHPLDQPPCKYCKQPNHFLLLCPNRTCIHRSKRGPGHLHHQCPQKPRNSHNNGSLGRKSQRSKSAQSTAATPAVSNLPTLVEPSPSSNLNTSDITDII